MDNLIIESTFEMQNKSKLYKFLSELYDIFSKSYQGHLKPHKFILLLCVLDLFDSGEITENKIYLDKPLINTYTKYYEFLKRDNETDRPWYPFFHLKSSTFWKHKIKPGFEYEYKNLGSEQGIRKINSIIEYSYLKSETFELFKDRKTRIYIENIINSVLSENAD